jgi:regulator of replication initiation timing
MNENRFKLRNPTVDKDIQCEEISDNGDWITYGDIVDLLNNIFKLKKEVFELKQDMNRLIASNKDLRIINNELKNEVGLFGEFFRNKNFTLDDFNEWLVHEKWETDELRMSFEAKQVLKERWKDI